MTRSVFIRRTAALVLFLAALTAWALLGAAFLFDVDRPLLIAAAIAAALSTEALMWVGAGLLGWKVFESRAAIWRRLTGGGAA
ncbi:hypothetical protein ACWCOP_12515 [Maricaulaceae bacterium MS644]